MSKVNFQPPISGQELKSPDLPTEKKPASDSSAKITHAKSKHGGENILKRSVDLFRRISIGKSRVHVNMELDKKIGTRPNEESSTGHIKTRTQKTVSFSKSGHNNQPAVKSEPSSVRESKVWTRDELNLMSLTNGLIKVAKDKANGIDNNKKNELETAIRQLFSGRGEELNEATLKELKEIPNKFSTIPEAKTALDALSKKVDEALSKKAETLVDLQSKLSQSDAEFMAAIDKDIDDITADLERRGVSIKNTPNQPTNAVPLPTSAQAKQIAMPALDSSMLSAKAEILPELSVPNMKLDELMAALDNSSNIDEITAALGRMEVSSQHSANKPTSAIPLPTLAKAEKIGMPALDGSMLSAKAEILPKLSVPDMTLDEFMVALDKSNNIDEMATALERKGVSSKNTPNQPSSAVPLSADDELERALKELNDELKGT